REAGIEDPVALDLCHFYLPLLKVARKGAVLPIHGVLIREWDAENRRCGPGFQLGLRLYEIDGVSFVRVRMPQDVDQTIWAFDFLPVPRRDYRRLYRIALRCRRDMEPPSPAPVLPAEQLDLLWKNTIGYLESDNLSRIKEYGGRAKRGVLLTGAPGNGKTM